MNDPKKLTIGFICGGQEIEHEVDLLYARDIQAKLNRDKYDVILLGIDRNGNWRFSRDPDLIINPASLETVKLNLDKPIVMPIPGGGLLDLESGKMVEKIDLFFPITDDPIQGHLQALNVPYIGSDAYGTMIGKHKDATKRLLSASGIPVAPHILVETPRQIRFEDVMDQFGMPVFVKACHLGSSFGVYKVQTQDEFYRALDAAFQYDWKVLIEKAIEGRELECSVLGGNPVQVASAIGELVELENFFTTEAKYGSAKEKQHQIHTDLEPQLAKRLYETSKRTFTLLECEGFARIDFFLQSDGTLLVNEINTSPGIAEDLLFAKLWSASSLAYEDLLDRIIQLALERHQRDTRRSKRGLTALNLIPRAACHSAPGVFQSG